jgi:TIR domain
MKVFISYSRDDETAVESLVEDIEVAGVQVWFDRDLGGGEAWWAEILHQIRGCTIFVLALSRHSFRSKRCSAELEYARALSLPILAARIDHTDPVMLISDLGIPNLSAESPMNLDMRNVDYGEPTRTALSELIDVMQQSAAERTGLAEPLPSPPPNPYGHLKRLQKLGTAIRGRRTVRPGALEHMFHDIRREAFSGAGWAAVPVRPGGDLAAHEYGSVLLHALRRRPEISSDVAFEIDRFLGVFRGGSPGEALAAPPPPRKRKPSGVKDAEDKLHTTRTATRARVARSAPKRPVRPQPTQREPDRPAALEDQLEEQDVDCSVFAPPVMSPGSSALVQVFVHLPTQASAAGRMARQFDKLAQRRGVQTLEVPIAHGEHLTFELSIRGIEVVEPVRQLRWLGRPRAVQFEAVVPPDLPVGQRAVASLAVSRHGIPIGSVKFTICIDQGRAGTLHQIVGDEAKRYTRAFVSYASEDRAAVLARVQMLRLASIDYFQDIDMDPGERWEQELYRRIDQCDLFLLFWSQAAKDSEWVQREVQYALGLGKRVPDIRPVVIEGPPVPLPWDELAHLHFNDRLLSSLALAARI